MISKEEVVQFLQEVKGLIRKGKWDFIPRRKNLLGIAVFGLTISQAKQEILKLNYTDYDRGPLKDNDKPGEVWEFIKDIDTQEAYIKLKIDVRGCVCVSFHPSNGPKTFPFR
ncbi:type II toxin-antitoxin system MqsR family toxin [Desulfitobacterium sp.]|uniref:type II toxin-antitoxin system MqsR family toxin n=1 Tax=Desulfitobacterium sp. TaxID=49981 RepID=UPI002BE2E626|nr:type II toxin-antitoxin system MqsR family toxin [Desulfitobacterium sp.]HVJ49293.1 type II toxin-antitoxin system MqsR family toxin [Desulfitobacterium sp.]